MKQILLLALILFSIFKVNGQSPCATDEYDAYLKRTNPTYATERQKMEQEIYSILKNKQNNPNARIGANDCQQTGGVFTIPVVVHVIHKGEAIGTGTNISDAQIISAINGMNEKWRKITGDGIDLEIQFALSVRDTNNNATNGIIRYDGRVFPNYLTNGIYYNNSTIGASESDIIDSTVWDRSKYLNIWVADIRGAGGWASLGSNYTFFVSYNISSGTLAHEMGHTFLLNHTFKGDGSLLSSSTQCPINNDCLLDGDGVCDTPPHRVEDCSTTTCASSGDLQNSFKNYMSYCGTTTRFTQGQKDRVRSTLYRDNFWNLVMSDALIPINTIPLEVGIVSIVNFLDEPICNNFVPRVKIKNIGTTTITNLKITTYVDGVLYGINTLSTNLIKNAINIYSLDAINFQMQGKHSISFMLTQMNSSTTDYSSLNNQICKDILVRNDITNGFCLDFENINNLGIINSIDSFIAPRISTVTGCNSVGTKAISYLSFNENKTNFSDDFYLPYFSIANAYKVYFSFDRSYKQGFKNTNPTLTFGFYNNCDSATFANGWGFNSNLATVTGYDSINAWKPSQCSHWKRDSVDLGIFGGITTDEVLIKVSIRSSYNSQKVPQNLYLDNFCIHKKYRILMDGYAPGFSLTFANGNSIYNEGDSVIVTANQLFTSCYIFKSWTENGIVVSTNPQYKFIATSNRSLHANFERKTIQLQLSVNPLNAGIVTGGGTYNCDTSIIIKARSNYGYTFYLWVDSIGSLFALDSNQTISINQDTPKKVVAWFNPINFPINYNYQPTGVISHDSRPYNSLYTVRADTNYRCYQFTNWTENGNVVSTNPTYTFTVTGPRNLVANFVKKQYSVSVLSNDIANGTVTGSGTYGCDTTITMIATPTSCYTFTKWTENGSTISTNATYSFTVTANRNLVANFTKKQYVVSVSLDNVGNGTVTGNGTYGCDTTTNVTATPASCYNFTKWTENGITVSTNANYTFTVTYSRNLLAMFEPKRYNITLVANPTNGGTVAGAGNFVCDSSLTVKAKVKMGYKFTNWTEGSTVVSTDSNYTFLISGVRSLKANFSLVTGIKQSTINEISKVYPNPANDILQVEIRSKQNTLLTLNIIDMKGSLLETKTLTNTKGTFNTSFDVSKLSKGNYILNLYDEEGIASYKFVVQ